MKRTNLIDDKLGLEMSDINTLMTFNLNSQKIENLLNGNTEGLTEKEIATIKENVKGMSVLASCLFHELFDRMQYFGALYPDRAFGDNRILTQKAKIKAENEDYLSKNTGSTLYKKLLSSEYNTIVPETNKDFVLSVIHKLPESWYAVAMDSDSILKYVSFDLRDDYDVVMAAVEHNGLGLQYASAEFKDNYEIVLAAVKQNGKALQFVSEGLKNNPEIVIEAMKSNYYSLEFVPKSLWNTALDVVADEAFKEHLRSQIENNLKNR